MARLAGKDHARHDGPARTTPRADWSRQIHAALGLIAGVAIGATIVMDFGRRPATAERSSSASIANSTPSTVYELIEQPRAKHWDIARANLLCAKGLPEAEHLDVDQCLRTLDSWVELIRSETRRYLPQFERNPGEYENSPGYYRMIMMVTVLQQDLGVRYSPDAIGNWDFSDPSDVFIHGLLGEKRTGTCASMPVLYVALGRRLGYPVNLVPAKGHLFVRWEDTNKGGERFNIEATSQGIICKSDEHYMTWPMRISKAELATGYYLRSLTPDEELAEFLTMRGNCLEDVKRRPEAVATYAMAHRLVPNSPRYRAFLNIALGQDGFNAGQVLRPFSPNQKHPLNPLYDQRRDAWVDAVNEHNRRLLAGELPPHSMPPSYPDNLP